MSAEVWVVAEVIHCSLPLESTERGNFQSLTEENNELRFLGLPMQGVKFKDALFDYFGILACEVVPRNAAALNPLASRLFLSSICSLPQSECAGRFAD